MVQILSCVLEKFEGFGLGFGFWPGFWVELRLRPELEPSPDAELWLEIGGLSMNLGCILAARPRPLDLLALAPRVPLPLPRRLVIDLCLCGALALSRDRLAVRLLDGARLI